MTPISHEPLTVPFTVLIDQREKLPYAFAGLRADAKDRKRPLVVPALTTYLPTGDYAIAGLEDRFAVERKSKEDLFGTIGQHRDRFERELERLARMSFAAVVVEADWDEILSTPPEWSQLDPKTVFRSYLAWEQRYPTVHWKFCFNRAFAEVMAFRTIERFWKETQTAAAGRKE